MCRFSPVGRESNRSHDRLLRPFLGVVVTPVCHASAHSPPTDAHTLASTRTHPVHTITHTMTHTHAHMHVHAHTRTHTHVRTVIPLTAQALLLSVKPVATGNTKDFPILTQTLQKLDEE